MPAPKLSSDMRRKRRLAFWPYGILQKRDCDFSGEPIVTTHSPGSRFPVYKREHWFSDNWESPQMDIDWDRSFLDQLYELQSKTPHFHQLGKNNQNCDYADDVWSSKNAYLSRSVLECEDIYYVYRVLYSQNCMDITYSYELNHCYECTYCFKGFNLQFCLDCKDCSDSSFLYDSRGCRHCFMCWNLRNKEYHIFNKPYSKSEYHKKVDSLRLNSRLFLDELRRRFLKHIQNDAVHRDVYIRNSQICQGNFIDDCKNCTDAFLVEKCEDSHHILRSFVNHSMDATGMLRGEMVYEVSQCTDLNNVQCAMFSVDCNSSQYLDQCYNCSDCFGCIGLKRKQFCILNKPYPREEYIKLKDKLIAKMHEEGEYGDFFPYKFSYHGYNATLAPLYYDETKESIAKKGGFMEKLPDIDQSGISGDDLTDFSEAISDDLIDKVINCSKTGQPFKFIKQELDFYRTHQLPLPSLHYEERNKMRYNQLPKLHPRNITCSGCEKEVVTYYPESSGYKKIMCEECYLKEVY